MLSICAELLCCSVLQVLFLVVHVLGLCAVRAAACLEVHWINGLYVLQLMEWEISGR